MGIVFNVVDKLDKYVCWVLDEECEKTDVYDSPDIIVILLGVVISPVALIFKLSLNVLTSIKVRRSENEKV